MEKQKLTYTSDSETGILDISIDGVEFTTWSYDDDPQNSFDEFQRIYNAGYSAGYITYT